MKTHFFRDTSNRLTHNRTDIDSLSYPEVCRQVADHFNLKPSSDLVAYVDLMFCDFTDGMLTVELAWEAWFGFTATAKETAAEPLIHSIAAFLSESRPPKLD